MVRLEQWLANPHMKTLLAELTTRKDTITTNIVLSQNKEITDSLVADLRAHSAMIAYLETRHTQAIAEERNKNA